jgi:predicted HTH transcriptional regulator
MISLERKKSCSTNRPAGPELTAELKRSLSNTSFDQLPCPEADAKSLDMKRIKEAFASVGRKVNHIRNKVIARVFRELQLMEEWGTGYKRIQEACQKEGYQTPAWEELGTAIRVVFQPHGATQEKEAVLVYPEKELTHRQQKILHFLHHKDPLSAKKIYSGLRQEISERSFRNDLLELKARGLLKMLGTGPATLWSLTKT